MDSVASVEESVEAVDRAGEGSEVRIDDVVRVFVVVDDDVVVALSAGVTALVVVDDDEVVAFSGVVLVVVVVVHD